MAEIHRIASEESPAWRPGAGGNGSDGGAAREALIDHVLAARAIVDLAAAVADQLEQADAPLIDASTMRRALREALRHLELAEQSAHELPEVAS